MWWKVPVSATKQITVSSFIAKMIKKPANKSQFTKNDLSTWSTFSTVVLCLGGVKPLKKGCLRTNVTSWSDFDKRFHKCQTCHGGVRWTVTGFFYFKLFKPFCSVLTILTFRIIMKFLLALGLALCTVTVMEACNNSFMRAGASCYSGNNCAFGCHDNKCWSECNGTHFYWFR